MINKITFHAVMSLMIRNLRDSLGNLLNFIVE